MLYEVARSLEEARCQLSSKVCQSQGINVFAEYISIVRKLDVSSKWTNWE